METGTITPLLERLAAAGTVTRTRDVTDERRVLIELTPAGEALREPVQAVSGQIRSACKLMEKGFRTCAARSTISHGLLTRLIEKPNLV